MLGIIPTMHVSILLITHLHILILEIKKNTSVEEFDGDHYILWRL